MRRPPTRAAATSLVLSLLATLVILAPAPAGAQPSCFGSAPTIVATPGRTTVGTPGNDVIWGTSGDDVIRGGGGADKICARGGNDRVHGGAGADQIDLGAGNDRGTGGKGADMIRGKRGRDILVGNDGRDTLIGGRGSDQIRGGRHADTLRGSAGPDILAGGSGRDDCSGGSGNDSLSGCGGGSDTPDPGGTGQFRTLPPGADLPSEAACARRVRDTPEIRPANRAANNRRGTSPHDEFPEVTGNFTGTTGEIIQWAACKHGIDEDLVRAQLVIESWWRQSTEGDPTSTQAYCHPNVRTSSGPCPQSLGLGQVKYRFHGGAYEDANALRSTAYNVDYTYALLRRCYEGEMTWLNTVERGRQYRAGDLLGCMGYWFSGRWYASGAQGYIDRVTDTLRDRVWETRVFINAD